MAAETSSARGKSASARHLALPGVALTLAALTPINALALDECGAGTTVVCDTSGVPASNANPFANGISYTRQNVSLTLASGAAVNTSTGTPPASNGPTTVGIGVGIPALTTVAGNASITVDPGATVLVSQSAVYGLVIAGRSTSSPSTGTVVNNGTVTFTGAAGGRNIYVETNGDVSVTNGITGVLDGRAQYGINARDAGDNHNVAVINNGQISSTGGSGGAFGILVAASGATGSASLVQTGSVSTNGIGTQMTLGSGAGSVGAFQNSGDISGGNGGIGFNASSAAARMTATNTGSITASGGYGLRVGNGDVTFTNAGTIVGTTAGVSLESTGNLTNSGTITGGSGTAISVTGSNNALILTDGSVLNGNVVSTSAGTTILLQGSNNEDSNLTGFDSLTMDGSNWTLGGTVSTTGTTATATNVQAGTLVIAGSLTNGGVGGGTIIAFGGTLQLGTGGTTGSVSGAVDVGAGGTLAVRRSDAVTLGNALTGSGVLDVDTQGEAFDFGATAGSAFAGTVALGNSTFQLGELNAAALESATLRAGVGSHISVADGVQTTGGLAIQGGTLAFNAAVPDQQVATSTIKTGLLDASGTGAIAVSVPTPYTLAAPGMPNTTNLLTQDDGHIGTRLIEADSVQGSGGALALVDQDGNVLSDGRSVDIAQAGNVVARGNYDYRLSTAPGDGLYVNYGLTALDLTDGQTLTLAPDTDPGAVVRAASPASSDMSARISGQGNLTIDAGLGVVSLSSATNDYTGATRVDSGTLRLDADNALGNTRLLALAIGTSAEINGSTQSIGAIDVESGALLDLGGGSLTLTDGGRSAGTVTGAGKVAVSGGTLQVQGANESLAADVAIADGATVQLDSAVGLGSGVIANDGQLAFNGADDGAALSNALAGNGIVSLQGQSNLVATGDNSGYAGTFEIGDGSTLTATVARNLGTAAIVDYGDLIIANATDSALANAISGAGNVKKQGAGVLSVAESLTYTGATNVNEGLLRAGQANTFSHRSAHIVAKGATLDTAGFNQTVGSLRNAGVVNLASDTVGSTLTVAGNYVGSAGELVLGTALGGDDAVTDKLVVQGDTSGDTRVRVHNVRGTGSSTQNGIRVVEVGGASNGTFELQGRAVAGAYEYALVQGGKQTSADGNWYLRSDATDIIDPGPMPEPVFRPELAAYLGNQQAAVRMFRQSLHDRAGEPGLGAAADDRHGVSSWVRLQSNHLNASTIADQVNTDTGADTVQVGGHVQFDVGFTGRLQLGAMGGHGRATTDGISQMTGLASQGRVEGNSVGLYGTWYQNATRDTGLYVDGWAQYGCFDNTAQGDSLVREDYRSRTLTGSLEAGYATRLHTTRSGLGLYLEPQLQVIHSDFDADDVTEANGTVVDQMNAGGTTTRVGTRLYARSTGREHNRVQPFVAVNWWSGGNVAGVALDGEYLRGDLPKDIFEAKAGAQLELGRGWAGWGQLSRQSGSDGFKDVSAQMGFKLHW